MRLNPQDWHRETNLIEDIAVRLRARRKRQDPRTERLPQSMATVLVNSRRFSTASAQKVSGLCLKNVARPPHRDEHLRHCFVCSVPSDQFCVGCSHPVCHDCSHKTLCTRCVLCNANGLRITQESSKMQASPRVDVDEAPYTLQTVQALICSM